MLKDTTWKLKTCECSSVIGFEDLSRIVSLCGFQDLWSFLVFGTISIHSLLLFTLIAYWQAISEEMSLKFTNLFFLNHIPWISLFQDKSSIKSKGVWIGRPCLSSRKLCWNIIKNPISWKFVFSCMILSISWTYLHPRSTSLKEISKFLFLKGI
jgi:hypothetical protein